MSDLNKEALEVWGALKPMIDQEISSRTQGMVQRRKAKVTTAPSLATNTIGVTEAFGDEMFLPFVSNMISAKVGDFVWIEWMYGATNAFVSSFAAVDDKDVSVAGSLDVVSQRCYASLSSAGWYRACVSNNTTNYVGAEGAIVDFYITRMAGYSRNEVHKITLLVTYNTAGVIGFTSESSFSAVLGIDKIRVTHNSTSKDTFVDIHYSLSNANDVTVYIDCHSTRTHQTGEPLGTNWVAESLQSVADSPSGETVLTTYNFSTNKTVGYMRECSASLSSAGWYRVLKTADISGTIINFYIGRPYGSHQAETHKISFHVVGGGKSAFVEETSDSNSLFVNKIRCTYGGGYMYFDVHYSTSSYTNEVLVYFDVYGKGQANGTSVSMGLTNVADSPSGETVLKEYSFSGNTEGAGTITAGSYTESFYDGTYLYRQGQMVTGFIKAKMNATVPASAWRNIAVIPVGFRPYSSTDFLAINNAASNSGELHIQARIEQSTGNVVIWPYTAIASGTAIYLSFTYRAYSTN